MFVSLVLACWAAAQVDAGAPASQTASGLPAWAPRTVPAQMVREALTYQLRRTDEGFTYKTQRFVAKVASDGTVTFKDRHALLPVVLPLPIPQPLPPGTRSLEGTFRFWRERRLDPTIPLVMAPPVQRADAGAEGDRVQVCDAREACFYDPSQLLVVVQGSFDVTDEYMRMIGQDPYREEKARFLAATSEIRLRLAQAAQQRAASRSLETLPAHLAQIWRDARFSAVERRRLLHAVWRDTEPTVQGQRAAALVETFVRRHLPKGSAQAFTDAELASLPARDDGVRFAPYTTTPGTAP
jgi:hypothetical protein